MKTTANVKWTTQVIYTRLNTVHEIIYTRHLLLLLLLIFKFPYLCFSRFVCFVLDLRLNLFKNIKKLFNKEIKFRKEKFLSDIENVFVCKRAFRKFGGEN